MSIKKLIWRMTPRRVHGLLRRAFFSIRMLPAAYYDYRRFVVYSGINKSREHKGEQAARIIMAYHQLEKGLSLSEPRPGFGKEVVYRLLEAIDRFVGPHGFIAPATTAVAVLNRYTEFNERAGVDMDWLKRRIASFNTVSDLAELSCGGGTIQVRRAELETARQSGFASFFRSRYSVRHFSGGTIPESDLAEAVAIAQKTPSVCNRQAWKVHAYSDPKVMEKLLEIQAGSRGFGHQASLVLVVTCDLSSFVTVAERYQAWIDGGMFSMSLCLAFHSQGYGSCCLNWSKDPGDDVRLRQATTIADGEQIIMMMAVGTLPEEFRVAYSSRQRLEDVLKIY
jgi:nitroreductase